MRFKVGFWLGLAGSLLIMVLLFVFAPSVKKAYRAAEASEATAESRLAAQTALRAQKLSGSLSTGTVATPVITPRMNPTPANIPNTGTPASSSLPTLVYLVLIAAVLLLTSELLVVTRPRGK